MLRKDQLVELLNPNSAQLLTTASLSGQTSKIPDKYSQSDLLSLSKSGKISIPRTSRQHLNLPMQYITLQIFLPTSKSFTLELLVLDSSNTRRKLHFTSCRSLSKDTLLCKVPNSSFPKDCWLNLCIDISSFTAHCFSYNFEELDSVSVSGYCKIRRILLSKQQLSKENMPEVHQMPGHSVDYVFSSAILEDTCSLLDVSRRNIEGKINEWKKDGFNSSNKSSSHIANSKSVRFGGNKKYFKVSRHGGYYEDIIKSLGKIRHSTPPFVHMNKGSLLYDPIAKSYVS